MIIKTFNLTADKTNKVELADEHSFFIVGYAWVINNTSDDIYISLNADMAAESDGTAKVSSGSIGMLDIDGAHKNLYAIGNGKIEVRVTSEAICPFKSTSKGGEATSDAKTVNGHTVESDVPADAKFTDTTNSDVTATGNPVQLDGLQGGVPFSEMVVSGKNLMPFPYYDGDTITSNGVTFTVNADGTVTANGTVSTGKIAYFCISHLANKLIPGTKYTLSGCPEGGGNDKFSLYISERTNDDKSNGKYYLDYGDGITFEMGDYEKYNINIQIRSGVTVDNVVFHPQLELGSVATEYEAPITGRELTVSACGKNLLKYPYYNTTKTISGITFTDNGDGTITANGTATATASYFLDSEFNYIGGITYTISGCPKGGSNSTYKIKGDRLGAYIDDNGNGATYSFKYDTTADIVILIYKDTTVDNIVFRPQLEIGSTATDYEPYHGAEYTITPDSNPYVIPNDIRQLDGLNTISVSAGTLSVTGVRKNAAIKRIWDEMGMDLLFDGVTSADNPAVIDLANYKFVEIHHIMIANEKAYPTNIRLSLDSYLSSASTIITPINGSSINTIHTEEGTVSSLYAISASNSNMNNTKIYGIK